jgi:ABC-type transport system involved in cytochrome c biogenesis permease subunit
MDGPFYVDTRAPHISADVASVTLAAANKAIIPAANIPVLGSNYFSYVGKALRIKLFGRLTTAATPGNGQWNIYWGTGADANGTVIGSSAALALTANQANMSWFLEIVVRCRAMGVTGALLVTGEWAANVAVLSSSLQPALIPASVPAPVTVDLTASNIISPQFLRSGSTAETMQVHDVLYEALN